MILNYKEQGFTLIELLVVISIIGVLSTIAMTSLDGVRKKTRDARRLSDVKNIQLALELYYIDHNNNYPQENSSNGDWEISYEDNADFIDELFDLGYMPSGVPVDPVNSGGKYYYYYVYGAGAGGCPIEYGEFYVLGIKDMETSGRPYPGSPGWSCVPTTRDWQTEFDWVTGGFEKEWRGF